MGKVFHLPQCRVDVGKHHGHGSSLCFGELLFGAEGDIEAIVAATLVTDAMHRSGAHFLQCTAQSTFQASVFKQKAAFAGVEAEGFVVEFGPAVEKLNQQGGNRLGMGGM